MESKLLTMPDDEINSLVSQLNILARGNKRTAMHHSNIRNRCSIGLQLYVKVNNTHQWIGVDDMDWVDALVIL